ncbi:MAG TPA: flagella basal body P-ring formation protein FlgA [Burkholderiaceae bacterium]
MPIRLRAAGLLLAAGVAWSAAGAHAVRIELRGSASTSATRVTLADIASIHDADDALAARLGALDVGQVAADGLPTVVDRAALARWIQARTGLLSEDIAWSGAERCSVRFGQGAATSPVTPVARGVPVGLAAAVVSGRAGVLRGSLATLHSTSGAIRLESRVEVLQDGVVGQDVRVRLPGASESVQARVTGPGQVEVVQ